VDCHQVRSGQSGRLVRGGAGDGTLRKSARERSRKPRPFGAQFPLAYLARINATIERLLDLCG
jgi:hypothetical protein